MTAADIAEISILEKQCFKDAWSLADFEYELMRNPYSKMWALEEDGKIIGYYGIWLIFDRAELTTIAIIEEKRSKGYGKLLLSHALNEAKNGGCEFMTLEVRVSNQLAQRLYMANGFEVVSIKKDYYKSNHEDAYMMMKGLI